jgi:Nucleotide modification associated domain 3
MFAMPIPYEPSPVCYEELEWRERDLGELVERLTRRKILRTAGAHLDPDLREGMRRRPAGWKPSLGQHKIAQAHLRKHGVGPGDLFLFWGLFRAFEEKTGWTGERRHVIWGWLQVGEVASVDDTVRPALTRRQWRWAADHPHLCFKRDPTNTLYVATEKLTLAGKQVRDLPGAGAFDFEAPHRRLTWADAPSPMCWSLPEWFLPGTRQPLSYHGNPARWSMRDGRVELQAARRGQEFILDTLEYPEAIAWAADMLQGPGNVSLEA